MECTSETNNWNYNRDRITASFDENGGHFVGNDSSTFKQVLVTNTTGSAKLFDGTKDYTIEYDIKKDQYAVRLSIWDNGNTQRQMLWFGNNYDSNWHSCKFVYSATNHTIIPYVDGTALTPVDCSSWSMSAFGLCFLDNSSNQMDFYVKNIKIYHD